jgi:hypothetical protein
MQYPRLLVEITPDPVARKLRVDREPMSFRKVPDGMPLSYHRLAITNVYTVWTSYSLNGIADPAEFLAWPTGSDTQLESLARGLDEIPSELVHRGEHEGFGGVAVVSIQEQCEIDVDDVFRVQGSTGGISSRYNDQAGLGGSPVRYAV